MQPSGLQGSFKIIKNIKNNYFSNAKDLLRYPLVREGFYAPGGSASLPNSFHAKNQLYCRPSGLTASIPDEILSTGDKTSSSNGF